MFKATRPSSPRSSCTAKDGASASRSSASPKRSSAPGRAGRGLPDAPYADTLRDGRVVELVRRHVEHANARLARHEAIRRWAILPAELKVQTGELTPSLKVRRRLVEQKYRHILEGLYAERPPPDSP